MIWLFERGDRVARLVTRFDTPAGEYVLEMEWSDGLVTTERFSDFEAFQSRVITLEHKLLSEEWRQATGRLNSSRRIGGSRRIALSSQLSAPPIPDPDTILTPTVAVQCGRSMNQLNLTRRVAIVTGAARGIGYATAKRALQSGAAVALWDMDGERLESAREQLSVDGVVSIERVDLDRYRIGCVSNGRHDLQTTAHRYPGEQRRHLGGERSDVGAGS